MRRKPQPTEDVAKMNATFKELPGQATMRVQAAEYKAKAFERELKSAKAWTPERMYWLLGLVPASLVALQILIAAKGDPNTLRSLVQNLNITAIFLATVLPFALVVLAFLCLSVALTELSSCRRMRANDPMNPALANALTRLGGAIALGLLVTALSVATMPSILFVTTLVICTTWLGLYMGGDSKHRFTTLFQAIVPVYLFAVMAAGVVFVLTSGMWLPREELTFGRAQTGAVYVLSSDSEWTKYLDEATNSVEIVVTKYVTKREIMPDDDNWTNQTVAELISRHL
ncbi:hypothetical protein MPRF_26370 [Mycolicibacterium parafortuitum]|uniref:Uncharacterized protein n=1 Tax=Mycolicibacterium parafortuitum TaxID=39692 RepID=A0A7I7U307_MYCPF|nr:hypothetical protein [Mycolicibacterium parafortuitum]BBY75738.1 hypothetical protein MPRF_26370 [Mycolicibacterium parafortuitum]